MPFALNLPAGLIVAAVTILLIFGIRESARANSVVVIIKLAVVVFFISFGAFMVNPPNWSPMLPNGFSGVMSGAAIVFFAFIGFDAVSTTAEETKNPQRDMPIGMIASLVICTLLYVLMSGCSHRHSEVHGLHGRLGGGGDSICRCALGAGARQCRRARRHDFSAARVSARPAAHLHGDVAGWLAAASASRGCIRNIARHT